MRRDAKRGKKRPVHMVLALIGSFLFLAASVSTYHALHQPPPGSLPKLLEAVSTPTIDIYESFVFIACGFITTIVAIGMGIRAKDSRPTIIGALNVLLGMTLLFLATLQDSSFIATLAGIFASLILAVCVLRPEDARIM